MTADMLPKLPREVLELVLRMLRKTDLKSLSHVSSYLHGVVAGALWRSITIEPWSEYHLHRIPVAPLPPTCQLTTQLHFRAELKYATTRRCPHAKDHAILWDSDEDELDSDPDCDFDDRSQRRFVRLTQRAKRLLDQFGDGQLQSFSWDLGTCIASEILGDSGIVSIKHANIGSLSLTTDYACPCYHCYDENCDISLSSFRKLQSLCWKAPSARNLGAAASAIRNNSPHLQTLTLDFVDWPLLWDDLDYDSDEEDGRGIDMQNFFVNGMLGFSSHSPSPLLPCLRTLSLSQVPLVPSMARVINFDSLKSLTLRMCPGWEDFLTRVVQLKLPIKLTTLEIQEPDEDEPTEEPILRFLNAFHGLDELFLNQIAPVHTLHIWSCIARRHATLRKFVQHQRARDRSRLFSDEHDLPNLALWGLELFHIAQNPSHNPIASFDLQFLGLSCVPELLKYVLLPFRSRNTLKVLHIRQSASDLSRTASWALNPARPASRSKSMIRPRTGRDFRDKFHRFAQWAFGPQGIASLQVVAFGDFAYGGRIAKNNVILCRNTGGECHFRLLDTQDAMWTEVRDEYGSAMEACPVEPVLGETCGIS